MLKCLEIENYLLIDQLRIPFNSGLNVLTGPTGSGKSMITSAIGLAFGGRVHGAVASKQDEPTIIRIQLKVTDELKAEFSDYLDKHGCIELERVIKVTGKSIYRCGGKPIKMAAVTKIRNACFSYRQQHQQLDLFDSALHIQLLDEFAEIDTAQVAAAYQDWQQAEHRLTLLKTMKDTHDETTIDHFYKELETFFDQQLTYDELNEQLDLGARQQKSIDLVRTMHRDLLAKDQGEGLDDLMEMYPENQLVTSMLALYQQQSETVKVISAFLEEHADQSEYEQAQQTLARWHELARKHRCQPYELFAVYEQLHETIDALANLDEDQALEASIQAKKVYMTLAESLTERRKASAVELAQNMSKAIQSLGMNHGLFFVNITQSEPSAKGVDACSFYVSTNPGQMPQPLKDTLSGGELSRVSLALQEQCRTQMRAIQLLDEVDVGISGHVAEQVAQLLYRRAQDYQIIAISHLPQMAMMADHHGYISKKLVDDRACVEFKWLSKDQRVVGLAELLAGCEVNVAAKQNAQQLLDQAQDTKKTLV